MIFIIQHLPTAEPTHNELQVGQLKCVSNRWRFNIRWLLSIMIGTVFNAEVGNDICDTCLVQCTCSQLRLMSHDCVVNKKWTIKTLQWTTSQIVWRMFKSVFGSTAYELIVYKHVKWLWYSMVRTMYSENLLISGHSLFFISLEICTKKVVNDFVIIMDFGVRWREVYPVKFW